MPLHTFPNLFLVMEQTNTGKCHHHIIFVAGLNHCIITDRTARLCNICHTALMGPFNIIREWEEGIRAQSHLCELIQPRSLFFSCKYGRFLCKHFFPCAICQHVHIFFANININGIVTLCSGNAVLKWQIQHFFALS